MDLVTLIRTECLSRDREGANPWNELPIVFREQDLGHP